MSTVSKRSQNLVRKRAGAAIAVFAATAALFLVPGCGGGRSSYASAEGASPPYVLKEGCKFSIIGENGRSSIDSMKVTGAPEEAFSMSISLGDYSITVSNCTIVGNSHGLPVYED